MARKQILAAVAAILASSACVQASPAIEYAMGFALGLESVIGSPAECIGDIAKISSACKNPKAANSDGDCMAAISDLMDKCGFKQITFGRLHDFTQSPIEYLEARAQLLLGNTELSDDMQQAQEQCSQQQYTACGVFTGKFVGLLIAAPQPVPAKDGAWIVYLLICLAAVAIAAGVWYIVVSTIAFVSDISGPCCKCLLILVLWILLILLINKFSAATLEAVPEVLVDLVKTGVQEVNKL